MHTRLGMIAALAALGVGGAGIARAEEGTGMKRALSAIGLVEPERPAINYRERPPLVLPPKTDLPTPQATLRQSDPAWPKDPEVIARARAEAESRKPITRGEGGRMNDNNTTLPIAEMRQGRRPGAGVPTEPEYKPGDNTRQATWLNPLRLLEGRKVEDERPSDIEPARDILTDPPTGYRKPPGGRLERTKGAPIGVNNPDRLESDPRGFLRPQPQQD